jgi:hypothetical protein
VNWRWLPDYSVVHPLTEIAEMESDLLEDDKATADELAICLADLEAQQVPL